MMTKGKAFGLCLGGIMLVFILTFAAAVIYKNPEIIPVAACLTGINVLAGLYIGGSVTNNGVKGHNWNQAMYDSENKPCEGGKP